MSGGRVARALTGVVRRGCGGLLTTTSTTNSISSRGMSDLPRLQDMTQGDKVSPVFSEGEFANRLTKLRGYMVENNIGATVLTSYHNVNYYSGFLYCSFGRPYALVVTPDDATVISAGIDGGQPWRRSLGANKNITFTDWHRGNFFHAVKAALPADLPGALGLEFDHVNVDNKAVFDTLIPNNKVDVGKPTMRLRMIKSAEEVAVIKNGAKVADIGGAAIVEALEDGAPEYVVGGHSTRAMINAINEIYPEVETMDTWTWFQSGINTDGAHNPLTGRRVRPGDILSLNCFPMIAGYYTALERTLFLGHASDEHMRLWEINTHVHEEGLKLIKPGNKCSTVAKELNEIYAKHDLLKYRSFGYGHSFGTLCHYYGREAELELREDIETPLAVGQVVSMEPMIMVPEGQPGAGGYREHDILVIGEDGVENITKFPYGPKHNVIKK